MAKSSRFWIRKHKHCVAIYFQKIRGESPTESINHPTLKTINEQLQIGQISQATAEKMAKELLSVIKPKKAKRVFGGVNAALVQKYWDGMVAGREHEDPAAALNRLHRGVSAVGSLSLHVATKEQLDRAIKSHPRRREAAAVINQLLKYLGRPFSLHVPHKGPISVTFLNEKDFLKALNFIKDENLKLFFGTLFYTGCRVGEAFALKQIYRDGQIVFVGKQIKRDGREADLKNKRQVESRRTVVDKNGTHFVREWVSLSETFKTDMRNLRLSEIFQKACRAAKVKPITCNGLRHSYAIHWLETKQGVSISHVARLLGNSESVCQRHYAGFVMTDIGLEALLHLA